MYKMARRAFEANKGDIESYLTHMYHKVRGCADVASPPAFLDDPELNAVMAPQTNVSPPTGPLDTRRSVPQLQPQDHRSAYVVAATAAAVALAGLVPAVALTYRERGRGWVTAACALVAVALAIAVVIMVVYRDSDVERTSQRLAIAGLSFCAAALVTATIVVHQLRSGRWHTEMPALMWATVLFLAIGGSTLAGSTTGLKAAV